MLFRSARRKVILQAMYEQGYITKEEQEEALADDVYARIQNVDTALKENETPYSYYTDELISQVTEALKEQLGYTDTQASNLLFSGGLQIYTPQDPQIQAIVDEEVNNPANYDAARYSVEYRLSLTHPDGETQHYSQETLKTWIQQVKGQSGFDGLFNSEEEAQTAIDEYRTALTQDGSTVLGESVTMILEPQTSFVLIEQSTGYVKAINGGRGQKTANRTLNRATDSLRQPGSTFKVISSFAPALDACGATLSTVYYDGPYSSGEKEFRNWWGSDYKGYHTIRDGITYSMNIVALRCMADTVTPQLGVEYAERLGITSLVSQDQTLSTALGGLTKGVSNLELTNAFAAIANGGTYTKPIFFTKILDRNGKDAIAVEHIPIPGAQVKEGFDRIPMWVADMNFPTAPTVVEAMMERVQHPAYGYFDPSEEYYASIIRWQEKRNGVTGLEPEHIGYENGVLGGVISALNVMCSKGDNVLLHSPTYIGFTMSLENNGYHIDRKSVV